MKRTHLFRILAILLLVAALLAGCAAPAAPTEDSRSTEQSRAAEPAGSPPAAPPEGGGGPGGEPPAPPPEGGGGPGGNPPAPPPEGGGGPGGNPPAPPPEGGGGPGGNPPGGSAAELNWRGAVEIRSAETQSGRSYAADEADESALLIAADAAVEITNPTVTKTGDSAGGDSCSFYGLNAAVLAKDGAAVTVSGGTVTSDAEGANGLFCYGGNGGRNGAQGDGTTLTVRGTVVRTGGGGSGGLMTTGGGISYAYDLDVETAGRSSAAIRTDRGGGQVWVEGGSFVTTGLGSPAIYCTAEIHVREAALSSRLSEGVCVEGKNSVELTDCALIAANTARNGNACFLDSVMLYQSMSGDADSGSSGFTMTGGSLSSRSGHVFHVTNTSAVITLSGVTIVNEDPANVLLSVCDDGWSGAGNRAVLKALGQQLSGAVKVGDNSSLTLELDADSGFIGRIDGQIVNARGETVSTQVGTVSVTLEEGAVWTLTGDSWISEFHGDPAAVTANGFTLYVNGAALKGTR